MNNNLVTHKKHAQDLRFLELFISTIEEYHRIIISLPIDWSKDLYEEVTSEDYSAVNIRALLVRKYITRSDNVHFKKITDKAKKLFPDRVRQLDDIYQEFSSNYSEQFIQTLEDGEELSLREIFDDIVYGLFLHADFDRSDRLSKSNEGIRFISLKRFVHSVENSINDLYNLLIECNITGYLKTKVEASASTIALIDNSKSTQKNITGFWSTLYGRDAGYDEVLHYLFDDKTPDEKQMLLYSIEFLSNISSGKTELEDMERLIFPLTASDWGDFSEARMYLESIPDHGIGSTINYNKHRDVAYVKILSNVTSAFVIEQHQIISANSFTFIKNELDDTWRIFCFGGRVDPISKLRKNK